MFKDANKEAMIEHFKRNRDEFKWMNDGEAGELVCRTVRGPATRHAYRITKNWEDAEDAVQDTYVKLLEVIEETDYSEYLDALFYAILTNVSKNILRRNRDGVTEEVTESDEAAAMPSEPATEPLRQLLSQEALYSVLEAMSQEPDGKKREAIELVLVYNLPFKEVSLVVNAHPSTVSRWIEEFRNSVKQIGKS